MMQNSKALQTVEVPGMGDARGDNNDCATVEALTAIWRRILHRPDIGTEDDFFAVGGDPSKAAELFAEIAQTWGREMASSVIYQARTVSALASIIEKPEQCIFSNAFPLKTGGASPPIFLASGLGGSVIELFDVLRNLRCERQVYGLEALGSDGMVVPFKSIEEMADAYSGSLRAVQPKGPYLLIGFSLGGLVMLEMAQRLSRMGEKIALLAMLDSYPHPRFLPQNQRFRLFGTGLRCHASIVRRLTFKEKISYVFSTTERIRHLTRDPHYEGAQQSMPSLRAAGQRAQENAHLALRKYQPSFYKGKIKFVRAANSTVFPSNPQAVWGGLAHQLEVETAPGDHHGMVQTEFQALGTILSRYIQDADGQ